MKKHSLFLAVAASVMFALLPAETPAAIHCTTLSLTEDIGPSIWTQLKPTVPPHAPRRSERLVLLAGIFPGSGLVYLAIPQEAGETDVTLSDPFTGTFISTILAPGTHCVPFTPSGERLIIHAVTSQGVIFDGSVK